MKLMLSTRILALGLLAPAVSLLPSTMSHRTNALTPGDIAALRANSDPALDSLRAGRADAAAPLAASVRAEIAAAQERDPSFAESRAGFAPSNNEWTWFAIGAGVVLLVVLL